MVILKTRGGTDTSARTIIEFAKDVIQAGRIFVPVNKPAGNGLTGLIEVANASVLMALN